MTDEERTQILDRLLQNQAHHDATSERLEELQMRSQEGIGRLEELQMQNQIAIGRINNLMADFTQQHHAAILEIDNRLIRLEALLEGFIRGSRHNGETSD